MQKIMLGEGSLIVRRIRTKCNGNLGSNIPAGRWPLRRIGRAAAATVEIRASSTPSSRISLLPGAVVNITVYLPSLVMRTIRALQYPSPLRVTRTLSPSRSAEPPVADDDAPPLPLQRKSQMVGEMLGGQKC